MREIDPILLLITFASLVIVSVTFVYILYINESGKRVEKNLDDVIKNYLKSDDDDK